MKCLYALIAFIFLFSTTSKSQDYTFRYNPYSGMNNAQLDLSLEQARKMERNGKVWTAVGTGMLVGGSIMTFRGINNMSYEANYNFSTFGIGLGIACFSGFPLGYGMVAWMTGNQKVNMIEIELLAFIPGTIHLKPTDHGMGLVLEF